MQCCGTLIIYCGSGSDFGKVSIQPSVFQQNLAFQCKKQRCVPKNWPLIFYFLTLAFHSMLDPDPNPVPEPETECTTVLVPVPLTPKVAVPVPQNTAGTVCYVRLFVLIFNAFGGVLFHSSGCVCLFIFR
jgi:hypothetical protein